MDDWLLRGSEGLAQGADRLRCRGRADYLVGLTVEQVPLHVDRDQGTRIPKRGKLVGHG
jgi:hypothetical protein